MISQEFLRKWYYYDDILGVLRHRYADVRLRIAAGDAAGYADTRYHRIKIDGKQYPAHVLIWMWHTGEWRLNGIDHKDRNGHNNRLINLRPTTASANQFNRARKDTSTAAYPGIRFKSSKWEVCVGASYIGRRDTLLDAAALRISTTNKLGV